MTKKSMIKCTTTTSVTSMSMILWCTYVMYVTYVPLITIFINTCVTESMKATDLGTNLEENKVLKAY